MSKANIPIYVGCSLNSSTDVFKASIEALKDELRTEYDVLDFLGTVVGGPADVWEQDINRCLRVSRFFLAVCDEPSSGLGIELGIAHAERIPTLAVAQADAHVSRLVQGMPSEGFAFERYDDLQADVPGMFRDFIAKHDR